MKRDIHILWDEKTGDVPPYPPLEKAVSADVAIVGAGITGLTAALLLKKAGKTVVVLDIASIGGGDTGLSTAHLTELVDARYHSILADFGEEEGRLVAESSRAAIERIATIVAEESIACDFRRVSGYLYTETDVDFSDLQREADAMRKCGLNVQVVDSLPSNFRSKMALCLGNQAQMQPRKYLLGLAKAVHGGSCSVHGNSRVTELDDGEPCRVTTEKGSVIANSVIIAADTPINNRTMIHSKIAPYRSYAIACHLNRGMPPDGLYNDTADPYHYIRRHSGEEGDFLIVGGADHRVGEKVNTQECFEAIETFARERFDVSWVPFKWSGQIFEPVDGLPYIGLNSMSRHTYIGTGYSGNGMTFGTLAGMMIAEMILEKTSPYADLYSATRFKPLASAAEFISHNLKTAVHFIGDKLAKPEVGSIHDIPEDEGRLVTVDKEKLAVYRDENGEFHACSPTCPHLGATVHWNSAEKSWDCPCHGSRFDKFGKVINGPAMSDLEPKTAPVPQLH